MTRLVYILAATTYGPMLVNRLDYCDGPAGPYGVGAQLLENGSFDQAEIELGAQLLEVRRQEHGEGVFVLDCGANIGTHTMSWARAMQGWGAIAAIEAQERVFYALAGNITLNNLFNARAMWAAVGNTDGEMQIPALDHQSPASFGSVGLRRTWDDVGQTTEQRVTVQALRIDSLCLGRLDLLKLDVEGMEIEALEGAACTIRQHRPVIMVEWIKAGKALVAAALEASGYRILEHGINLVGVHESDKVAARVKWA
jgi:FkbM family methyltransferase